MKKLFIVAAVVGAAVVVMAALPTFKTLTAGGNSTAGAELDFPADPNSQIRLVSLQYADDLAGTLTFQSGTGAYVCSASNTTSVTITLSATNGIAINDTLMLQTKAGVLTYLGAVTNRSTSSNLLASVAVTTVPGDEVFKMGTASTLAIAASTNWINGEAIYVGNYGRPVRVLLSAATATNSMTGSAHYDSQSQ